MIIVNSLLLLCVIAIVFMFYYNIVPFSVALLLVLSLIGLEFFATFFKKNIKYDKRLCFSALLLAISMSGGVAFLTMLLMKL